MPAPSQGQTGGYHAWITRHPVQVLVLAALVTLVAGYLAWHLKLRTAFSELLPSKDPGVIALTNTSKRIGDMSLLLVGIHSPDKAANERYAEMVTEKLRALPGHVVSLATYNVRDVKDFFEKNKWLYVAEDDLESIRDRLRTEINKRKNPLFVSLGDDEPIDSMQKRIGKRNAMDDRFPGGLFSSVSGDYIWVAALPPGGLFVEHAGESLYSAAQKIIAENPPESFHPQMRAQVSGPVATAIASREAIENDIKTVTAVCLLLVALSIGLYFRKIRAIFLTGIPAVIGAVVAFAVADLAFGYLTSSTAFLGSIILGNGINYAIVLMSRYEEQRARGDNPSLALREALHGCWRGTLVAAISASAAYASLMVTSFRGFYQFGVMGAVGALACWLATFTVLPAILIQLDIRSGAGARMGSQVRAPLNLGPLARFVQRWSTPLVLVLTVGSIASAFGLRHFLQDPFEYDFRKLNAKLNSTEESQAFYHSIDKLFGRWPSPTIILGDSIDEVEPIRATIRKQDAAEPGADVIGQITTVYDLLPGPPDLQKRKLALIGQIRKLAHDPALEVLDDKEREQISKVDPPPGSARAGPDGSAPDRAPAVHRGRRHHRTRGAGLSRRDRPVGVERARSAANRVGAAVPAPAERQGARDVGLGGRVRVDDPIDPQGRPDRDRGVVHRGAHHRGVHDPAGARRADGADDAGAGRALDGRRRRLGARARDVPELHRAADHLRHRRRIRAQRAHALPRGPQHRARRALDGRGGRALLVDHDRRLRLAAGGAQPGAERLRLDGDPGRGLVPDGGDRRAAGGAALVAQARREWRRSKIGDRVAARPRG